MYPSRRGLPEVVCIEFAGLYFFRTIQLTSMVFIHTQLLIQFVLFIGKQSDLPDTGDDWEVGLLLPGMLSHLNLVRIENAEGWGAEFKVLRYLMKNANGLEEIAVHPRASVATRRRLRKQYENHLIAFSRASSRIRMRWSGQKSTCLIQQTINIFFSYSNDEKS